MPFLPLVLLVFPASFFGFGPLWAGKGIGCALGCGSSSALAHGCVAFAHCLGGWLLPCILAWFRASPGVVFRLVVLGFGVAFGHWAIVCAGQGIGCVFGR